MPHKILVVDDDKVHVKLVKSGLVSAGYSVIVAFDGEEGFEKVKSENPDLIVLDIGMPKMNGYEFMTELKSLQGFETTPTIVLTVNETLEDVLKLEGIKAYSIKPVKILALIDKIQECIGLNPGGTEE